MSKYQEQQTIFTDGEHLVAALKELGYEATRHLNPIHLIGFHGDTRPEVAHVVIPRAQIGSSSNDIGFVREDGKYRAIISDYDSRNAAAKYGDGVTRSGFNAQWLGRLSQAYKERQTMAVAKAKGYVFQGRTVTAGKIQLKFTTR